MTPEIKRICDYLITNALPVYDKDKCGHCAKRVRMAVDFGLGKHIRQVVSAKNYGTCYEEAGFVKVADQDTKIYIPEAGDIAIIQYEPHGHICVYTPQGWVSDFKQRDMYGGKIRNEKPPFAIYRYKQQ